MWRIVSHPRRFFNNRLSHTAIAVPQRSLHPLRSPFVLLFSPRLCLSAVIIRFGCGYAALGSSAADKVLLDDRNQLILIPRDQEV
jgi:hypothetical protein